MASPNKQRQVFVVRVWVEQREIEDAAPAWRGEIEAVGNDEQKPIQCLDEIADFISPYLVEMGGLAEMPERG